MTSWPTVDRVVKTIIVTIPMIVLSVFFFIPVVPTIIASPCGHVFRFQSVSYFLLGLGPHFDIGPHCL